MPHKLSDTSTASVSILYMCAIPSDLNITEIRVFAAAPGRKSGQDQSNISF